MMTELTIQQVSKAMGLSIHTLRYYEKVGLLAPIRRASNGHRRYSAEDVAWLEFLVRLQETGMSIEVVETVLRLCSTEPTSAQAKQGATNLVC